MPVQRFKISPTCRGAIFKAKRWFYAIFCKKGSQEAIDYNKKAWAQLASRLVEEANKLGISEKPVRLTIEYNVDQSGKFQPIRATMEVFEMRCLGTHVVSI